MWRSALRKLGLCGRVELARVLGRSLLLSFPLPQAGIPAALTEAEQDVALRVYRGASNAEIARERGVSSKTIGKQLESIYRKLGVSSRTELVLRLRGKRGS